jgi:hypothetical protein
MEELSERKNLDEGRAGERDFVAIDGTFSRVSLSLFRLFAGADRRFVFWQMTAAKTCCPITENLYFYRASCINWMQTALQWKIFRPPKKSSSSERQRNSFSSNCAIKVHTRLCPNWVDAKKIDENLHCVCHCDDNCLAGRLETTEKLAFILLSRFEGFTRFGSVFSWL